MNSIPSSLPNVNNKFEQFYSNQSPFSKTAIKAAFVAALVIFAVILAPSLVPIVIISVSLAGFYYLGKSLQTRWHLSKHKESLITKIVVAKQKEESQKRIAIQGIARKDLQLWNIYKITSDEVKKITQNIPKLLSDFNINDSEHIYLEFVENLKHLLITILRPADKIQNANQNFIASFRKVLNTQCYQMLKEVNSEPSINFLHHLASAIWNEVIILPFFQELGKEILKNLADDAKFEALIFNGHEKVSKILYTDHGINKIFYAITHPIQAIGSIASLGGRAADFLKHVSQTHGIYDSHGKLGNHPSLQSQTFLTFKETDAVINNVYGGSPTVDETISPEFEAMLQAAENNRSLPQEKKDPRIPDAIQYTNLQNIASKAGEGIRSEQIMKFQEKYPHSFFAMTLAKDSKFYRDHSIEKDLEKNPNLLKWSTSSQFGNQLLEQLLDDSSFDINKRTGGSGFYFPGSKEDWEKVFTEAIELTNSHFIEHRNLNGIQARNIRIAYIEFVYALLEDYAEFKLIRDLIQQGVPSPKITTQKSCKENIDRGGAENVKYAFLKLESFNRNEYEQLIGMLEGRPLLARDRIILDQRLLSLIAFLEYMPNPKDYQALKNQFLSKFFKEELPLATNYKLASPSIDQSVKKYQKD